MRTASFTYKFITCFLLLSSASVMAENAPLKFEKATVAEQAQAVGHYARARSLLIAAIREFDKGVKTANPDSLIDSEAWRNTLLDRSEDLEHILAPQPRISEGGVQYEPDSRLISEEYR